MATIILGHGGFDRASSAYPPEVLVPTGSTLRFFSDAGQALTLPATDDGAFDYQAVADVWTHFQENQQPIPERWLTYNFELGPQDTQEEYDLAMAISWGATPVSIVPGGEHLRLCDGTADTCPTAALRVQQQDFERDGTGEAVPDERWLHNCTGILGTYGGQDIIWMSCTGFMLKTDDVGTLATSKASGPGLDTEWDLTDAEWASVNEANRAKIKSAEDGDTLPIAVAGLILLVGTDHEPEPSDYVRRQQDLEEGELTVTKGSTFSSGKFEITGISAKQSIVEAALEQISDKKIVFN